MRRAGVLMGVMAACVLWAVGAAADTVLEAAAAAELGLEELVELGLKNNLVLRNAGLDRRLAGESAESAESVFDPRLALQSTHTDSGITDAQSFLAGDKEITAASAALRKVFGSGTRVSLEAGFNKFTLAGSNSLFSIPPYSASASLSISQPLWRNFLGEMDRAGPAMAGCAGAIAECMYERECQKLVAQVTEAYWDLYGVEESYLAAAASLSRARDMLETNRVRMAEGLIEETDVLSAEALYTTREADLAAVAAARANVTAALLNLVRRPVRTEGADRIVFPSDAALRVRPAPDVAADAKRAFDTRPDLRAVMLAVTQSASGLALKRSAARPDLQLLASYTMGESGAEFADSVELGDTAWMVGLTLEVPLWRRAELSAVRQAELAVEKAENSAVALMEAVALEMQIATRALDTARVQLDAAARAMDIQSRKLALETDRFMRGLSSTRWLVQFEDDLTMAEMWYHAAVAELRKAEARYELAIGTILAGGGRQ